METARNSNDTNSRQKLTHIVTLSSLYIIRITSHRHSITAASTSFKTTLPVMKYNTTKLSYRKDDRAMRLYTGYLKIFGSPWLRPRLLFPTFNGLLFRSILRMYPPYLKFVALPVLTYLVTDGTLDVRMLWLSELAVRDWVTVSDKNEANELWF